MVWWWLGMTFQNLNVKEKTDMWRETHGFATLACFMAACTDTGCCQNSVNPPTCVLKADPSSGASKLHLSACCCCCCSSPSCVLHLTGCSCREPTETQDRKKVQTWSAFISPEREKTKSQQILINKSVKINRFVSLSSIFVPGISGIRFRWTLMVN